MQLLHPLQCCDRCCQLGCRCGHAHGPGQGHCGRWHAPVCRAVKQQYSAPCAFAYQCLEEYQLYGCTPAPTGAATGLGIASKRMPGLMAAANSQCVAQKQQLARCTMHPPVTVALCKAAMGSSAIVTSFFLFMWYINNNNTFSSSRFHSTIYAGHPMPMTTLTQRHTSPTHYFLGDGNKLQTRSLRTLICRPCTDTSLNIALRSFIY